MTLFPNAHGGICEGRRTWFKSSYSQHNGCCLEVAADGDAVLLRDSKSPAAGTIRLAPAAWAGFLTAVKAGRLDGPPAAG